jgi:hypothetical protein
MLEDADIPFHVKNAGVQDLFGWGRIGTGYNVLTGPMILQVEEHAKERALSIVDYYIAKSDLAEETDPELKLLSNYNRLLNLSIILGIFFPGFGLFHLIKAVTLKRKNRSVLKGKFKIFISSGIAFLGIVLLIILVGKWTKSFF